MTPCFPHLQVLPLEFVSKNVYRVFNDTQKKIEKLKLFLDDRNQLFKTNVVL